MLKTVLAACALLCALTINAEARQRHKAIVASDQCNLTGPNSMPCEGVAPSVRGERIAKSMGFGSAQKVYTPATNLDFRGKITDRRGRTVRLVPDPRERVAATVVSHPPGCPSRAFCGCGAAVRVFGSPVRSLWLAANWFKFPRSAPAVGMVAVRRHHVFVLEAHLGGDTWQVYDANSGRGLTHIHARSLAGYVVVNPRGGAA